MSKETSEDPLFEHICTAFYTAIILEWRHLLKPDKYKQIIPVLLRVATLNAEQVI